MKWNMLKWFRIRVLRNWRSRYRCRGPPAPVRCWRWRSATWPSRTATTWKLTTVSRCTTRYRGRRASDTTGTSWASTNASRSTRRRTRTICRRWRRLRWRPTFCSARPNATSFCPPTPPGRPTTSTATWLPSIRYRRYLRAFPDVAIPYVFSSFFLSQNKFNK